MKTTDEKTTAMGYQMVKRGGIRIGKTNPRKYFDPEKLKALAANIAEHGILQPLAVRLVDPKFTLHEPDLVNKTWTVLDAGLKLVKAGSEKECRAFIGDTANLESYHELVSGERRWRASGIAKLDLVPCLVRRLTDAEVLEIQYIENLQREDLTAMEEAEGFHELIKSGGYTVQTLMEKLNMSRSHIFGRLKLVMLSKPVQQALREGKVDTSMAGLIAQIPDPANQEKALREIEDNGMSVRDFKDHITHHYQTSLSKAWFDQKSATLVPAAGACMNCPKRSGNMKEEFPDLKSPHVCTDTACFYRKRDAQITLQEDAARANGQKVLSPKESKALGYSAAGYVNLDEKNYQVNGSPTWREMLKKTPLKPVLARSYHDDMEIIELLPRRLAMELAETAGVKFSKQHDYAAAGREEAKARKENKRKRNAAIIMANGKLFEGLSKLTGAKLWRFVADCLARRIYGDETANRALEFLAIATGEKDGAGDALEKQLTKTNSESDLRMAALGMLLADDSVTQYQGEFGENILAAAELCGVDLEKLAKGFAKPEKEAKAKGKNKK